MMSSLLDKLTRPSHSDEGSDSNEQVEEKEKKNNENKKPVAKRAIRGRKAAALLSDSDDDSDDNACASKQKNSNMLGGGIYSMKINQTKKGMKDIYNTFENVDKKIVVEAKETEIKSKLTKSEKHGSDSETDSDITSSDSDDSSDAPTSSTHKDTKKTKLHKNDSNDESITLSPLPLPPSSSSNKTAKPKRKSTSAIEKQLMLLEKTKNSQVKTLLNDSDSKIEVNIDDDEIDDLITVKVRTKDGIKKVQIKNNEPFQKVYESLAKLEKTNVECLVLMLDDRKISHSDTPKSINLKIYDVIDCGKCVVVAKERIRIVENDTEETSENTGPNEISIMLQTQEGRKSRLKFLIFKNEKFGNVLKMYCDKKSLDFSMHMLEFDGDKVDLNESPDDLDLDGGEVFDVKKSSKPTSQVIKENNKKYEFDDDILCV